jgi:Flp pilus assembly protein CpaB
MRASTIFIWTFAILLGFAAVVVARLSGVFTPKVEPVAAKKPDRQILVAAKNLFAGDLINNSDVRVRVVKPEELAELDKNGSKYLPAVQQAAALRIAKKNIEADTPITRDMLEEMTKPNPLNTRLHPSMRAVNLSLLKDNSAGGLIQVGEWVDVLLTSNVRDGDGNASTHTAAIAKGLRVIAKRNILWPIFAPLPEDKPVQFTLEANPYQAALIEFAKGKGQLTIVAIPASEAQKYEERRTSAMANPQEATLVSFGDATTAEAKAEVTRLDTFLKGEAVGDGDLEKIFNLKAPPPPARTIQVEQYFGLSRDRMSFDSNRNIIESSSRKATKARASTSRTSGNYSFSQPDCADCGKAKRKK